MIFINVALVIATFVLAYATIKLAVHTRTLSKLTERLVRIESDRDEREAREKRREALKVGLAAAEGVQLIKPDEFARKLSQSAELVSDEIKEIETLHSMREYIWDTDCHEHLSSLCSTFDDKRRQKTDIRINEEDVATRVRKLQGRIQWFVDEARHEIATGKKMER